MLGFLLAFRSSLSQAQYFAMAIQYFSMAISLCNVLLISKMYGFKAVGIFVFYVSVQQIAGFAATLGVSTYSVRVLNRTANKRRVIILLVHHAGAVMLFGIAVFLMNASIGLHDSGELALLLIACWFGLIRYMIEDVSTGFGWFVGSSSVAVIENTARLIMVLLLGVSDSDNTLIILIIATAIAAVPMGYKILSYIFFGITRVRISYFRIYYRNSFIMFASHLMALFQSRMGVLAAPYILNATEVGIFALLFNLSEIALRVGGMVGRYIYVGASSRSKRSILSGPSALLSSVTFIGGLVSIGITSGYPFINSYIYDGGLTGYFASFCVLGAYSTVFLYFNLSSNLLYGDAASSVVIFSSSIGMLAGILLMIIALTFGSFFIFCSALTASALVSSLLNSRQLFLRHSIR